MSPTLLDQLVDSFLDLWWSLDPVAATGAGVTEHDHRLGRFGVDDLRAYVAALKAVSGGLEECAVDTLADEVDRTALLGEIRFAIHRFEREQPHVKNPAFWLSHALDGLNLLLVFRDRPREHRARCAARRIRELPGFFQGAQATLRDCPRVFVETAATVARRGAALLDEVARELRPPDEPEFDADVAAGRAALDGFARYLEGELLDRADDTFAIGEEAFNFRLHYQQALRATAPELWRYGLGLVDEVDAALGRLAAEIQPGASWAAVADRLRAEHPSGDGLVAAYAEAMDRARRFVVERGLVVIPPGALEVVQTPSYLRPLIPFAAYQPPGAFSEERTGWFYVTPPDGDTPADTARRMLRDHCVHDLPSTALHEGYPGHHLQFLTAHAQPRAVRKLIGCPLTIEGWALYCEDMMAEEGFYATPAERLFQQIALLWRAARVVVDVGLHTRGMSFDEAVAYMVDRVHFDRAHAEAEVRRYCAEPVYQLSYAVGRREFRALRDAYRAAHGDGYTLRGFHDAVLAYGGLPVSLIRWGMGLDE